MKNTKFLAVFYLFLGFSFVQSAQTSSVTFYVQNKCPFPIWPATASNSGQPLIGDGGFFLIPGQTHHVTAPGDWSGRFWARTGCNFSTNAKPACATGDCQGRLACNGSIGTPPATLVEISLQADKSRPSLYDVSLVDGYNLPVLVTSNPADSKCTIKGCAKNLNNFCPNELLVLNQKGEVVACKSACLAFGSDPFCCQNEFRSPGKCKPSVYSKIFKDACSSYYSYAFDTPSPMVSCSSKEYVITFCPSKWGVEDEGFSPYSTSSSTSSSNVY